MAFPITHCTLRARAKRSTFWSERASCRTGDRHFQLPTPSSPPPFVVGKWELGWASLPPSCITLLMELESNKNYSISLARNKWDFWPFYSAIKLFISDSESPILRWPAPDRWSPYCSSFLVAKALLFIIGKFPWVKIPVVWRLFDERSEHPQR